MFSFSFLFLNTREFYYIQMEKYARQALSEGVKKAEDLNVTDDCELLRVLNLHYNRSNHIPVSVSLNLFGLMFCLMVVIGTTV